MKAVIVSYLNTLPLRVGLEKFQWPGFSLQSMHPANCYRAVLMGEADLGLCPIAILHEKSPLKRWGNLGIVAKNQVRSVGVFSYDAPVKLEKIYLDSESRTSVLLLKWLCHRVWNIQPVFEPVDKLLQNTSLGRRDGILKIGNKALQNHSDYPVYTDLSEAWRKATGLPFVFAAWIGRDGHIQQDFIERFMMEQHKAVRSRELWNNHPEVLALGRDMALHYLTRCISYDIGPEEQESIDLFLKETQFFVK